MINNELDFVLLLIGLFGTLISSFIVLKTYAVMELKNPILIKLQNKVDSIIGIFSFTLLFLFGVALIVNSIVNTLVVSKLLIGIGISLFYIYIIYYFLFTRIKYVFKLLDIEKVNDKLFLLVFENEKVGLKEVYIKNKTRFKKGVSYNCLYSPVFNDITKVLGIVVEEKEK